MTMGVLCNMYSQSTAEMILLLKSENNQKGSCLMTYMMNFVMWIKDDIEIESEANACEPLLSSMLNK